MNFTKHAIACGVDMTRKQALPLHQCAAHRVAVDVLHPESQKPVHRAGDLLRWRHIDDMHAIGIDYLVCEENELAICDKYGRVQHAPLYVPDAQLVEAVEDLCKLTKPGQHILLNGDGYSSRASILLVLHARNEDARFKGVSAPYPGADCAA